jgi:hypothetical protein
MYRLFRKIRRDLLEETKSRKYLYYALGELLLVVLGILIALQINSWNEERIEQSEITRFAHALINDLEQDLVMIDLVAGDMQRLLNQVADLSVYVQGKSIEQLDAGELSGRMKRMYYRPYAWNRSALQQINSSGALRQMNNRELVEKISAYEAFAKHLDADFVHDRRNGNNTSVLRQGVVDMDHQPDNNHEPMNKRELTLLTTDINDVRVAVNSFLELAWGDSGAGAIDGRAENEIPRLQADIRELILLLKQEYPE